MALVKAHYADFGPTLAAEKLHEPWCGRRPGTARANRTRSRIARARLSAGDCAKAGVRKAQRARVAAILTV